MAKKLSIKQNDSNPTRRQIDAATQMVLVLAKRGRGTHWPKLAYADALRARVRRAGHDCTGEPFVTDLPNTRGTRVSIMCVGADISSFELLTLARRTITPQLAGNPREVVLCLPELPAELAARSAEALVSALLAASVRLPSFKQKPVKPARLQNIVVYGAGTSLDTGRLLAESEGNGLARTLTALPPNELTPARYRARVSELANTHGWKMHFHDVKALERRGAGAFLAVAQGSPEPDAGIVHLRYEPKPKSRKPALALVGKGICFDTGGMNLKPARYMHGMHEDMEGSAVALGTLLALTQLKVAFPVDCWLALAQNHIGPRAYKQNDVVTAANGTTIEVVHTDAEGRMVLADTLALASEAKPGLIIDYATLTGACVHALSSRYSGAFVNRPRLLPKLIEAGQDSGERVWPFPADADFDSDLDSTTADVKQCTLDGEADHILATRFLGRFVDKRVPWVHIDLAAGNRKGGLAHIPTDTTGFGVRFTLNLLLDQCVMQAG